MCLQLMRLKTCAVLVLLFSLHSHMGLGGLGVRKHADTSQIQTCVGRLFAEARHVPSFLNNSQALCAPWKGFVEHCVRYDET